jgi:phosphatidylserine/phosphatidylglycerophosphate/cardiolipin synthase-like enzyme
LQLRRECLTTTAGKGPASASPVLWGLLARLSPRQRDGIDRCTEAVSRLPGKVHHKFAVIDVEGDDPTVVLGSYNWTAAGAYDNDENTLIIHNRELAQACYAEWQRLWATVPLDRICNPFEVHLPAMLRTHVQP